MEGVFNGFATIGLVISLGFFLAHIGLIDPVAQQFLARLTFLVASPALLFNVLSDADLGEVFSRNLLASVAGIAFAGITYVLMAYFLWRKSLAGAVLGMLSAVFVNAANLGLPIVTYVLGDATLIVPMLLIQMVIIQPIALTVLDRAVARARVSIPRLVMTPFRNPLTVGAFAGALVSQMGISLPVFLNGPIDLVAGLAIPSMLMAYGASLRVGPRPGSGGSRGEVLFISFLKLVIQPLVAYLVARIGLGLAGLPLLSVTVIAALPTAQNIFIHASRYKEAVVVVRDVVFLTTILSAPVIFLIAVVVS